jgi:serpin B
VALAACGNDKGTVHPVGAGSPSGSEVAGTAARSINALGADLARQLAPPGDANVAFSPSSVATALAMVYPGARGKTASQIADVLHTKVDPGALAQAFGDLKADLARREGDAVTLATADAMWGQQGTDFLPDFLRFLEQHFGAALQRVDYMRDADAARVTINRWVADHTQGRITDLFPRDAFDDSTRLVLTDAVYLLAKWAVPFVSTETATAPFFAPGRQVQARMMSKIGTLPYADADGTQALELAYAGDKIAADVVLPKAGELQSFVEHLDARLPAITARLSPTEIELHLPSFTATSRFELTAVLRKLGMPLAFTDNADFSGMTAGRPLQIATVAHQAYLRVDEEGTEAAAATGIGLHVTSKRVFTGTVMTVDRPFLFVIRDRTSGTILFLAQIHDPTAGA